MVLIDDFSNSGLLIDDILVNHNLNFDKIDKSIKVNNEDIDLSL